jgi:hypothetical protein
MNTLNIARPDTEFPQHVLRQHRLARRCSLVARARRMTAYIRAASSHDKTVRPTTNRASGDVPRQSDVSSAMASVAAFRLGVCVSTTFGNAISTFQVRGS